ncbi:MAG: YraN family protein [Candidatus Omnitrophota bacterium]
MRSHSGMETGKTGEKIAETFLRSRGFHIIGKNYRTPFGEIDLIGEHKGLTVFVEVKTRVSQKYDSPLSAITWEKKRHIIKNCLYYMSRYNLHNTPCRIDVIAIKLNYERELEILWHVRDSVCMEEY